MIHVAIVTIGFAEAGYTVMESDGEVEVLVEVLDGMMDGMMDGGDVVVTVATMNGSAGQFSWLHVHVFYMFLSLLLAHIHTYTYTSSHTSHMFILQLVVMTTLIL